MRTPGRAGGLTFWIQPENAIALLTPLLPLTRGCHLPAGQLFFRDITVRAVKGSGAAKQLAGLQQLLAEQQRKGGER